MGGALLLTLLLAAVPLSLGGGGGAHPGYSDDDESACTVDAGAELLRRMEERGPDRRIIDITHAVVPDLPAFATGAVAGPMLRLRESMADGSEYNLSELRLECHMGTHVDAPGHMNQGHFAAGLDVDTLDLHVLNGTIAVVMSVVMSETRCSASALLFLGVEMNMVGRGESEGRGTRHRRTAHCLSTSAVPAALKTVLKPSALSDKRGPPRAHTFAHLATSACAY